MVTAAPSTDFDTSLAEELELFRENVGRFVQSEIEPHVAEWEENEEMPRKVWNQLGEAGLLCVDIPSEYGGSDVPASFAAAVIDELSRANCTALASLVGVHSDIVAHYLLGSGTEEQKQKYLPRMASGELVGAIAMTEPAAGSDLQGIRTTARRDGDDFVIDGSKTFITNGHHAGIVLTVARTNPDVSASKGMSIFIVESDTPGFSRGKRLEKIGQHSADTMELFYDGVRVGQSQLLGDINNGFVVLMDELPRERWMLALTAVAAAEAALDMTVQYVQERKAFGAPLAKLQNTRFRIAEMKTELTIHRAFIDHCTALLMNSRLDTATASMAKLSCTEMQGRIADGCLQLFGGYGYMREYPISRAFVDARVQRIYGGASEIMKEIIGRSVLGRG